MPSVGSDNLSLAGFSGAVVDENGQTLLSTDTTGSQARIVGQSLQRELTDGVANGDFAIPPLNAESAIDADGNELPYWTWSGATGITASITAETTWSANGNALLISVGTSATAGSFGTLTRYVPISNSGNRNYCYSLELFVFGATGAAADKSRQQITASWQAVDKDYAVLTETSSNLMVVGSTPTEQTLSTEVKVPDAKAAYLLVTLKFEVTPAAVSATTTYRIGEVRLNRGQPSYTLSSLEVPSSSPWSISNDAEVFYISRGSTANLHISASADPTADFYDLSLLASDSAGNGTITLEAGDTVYVNGGTTVDITAPSGVDVSGRLRTAGGITNTGTITSTSHITGGRFYPSNQATRYIEDNGTYLRAINDFWAVGSLFQSSSGIRVPVIRVGETATASTSIPANGSLVVTVTFPALPATPNFAVLGIRWAGTDSNATVVCSGFTSTTTVTARLYNQTSTAITSSRAINYVLGAEN